MRFQFLYGLEHFNFNLMCEIRVRFVATVRRLPDCRAYVPRGVYAPTEWGGYSAPICIYSGSRVLIPS